MARDVSILKATAGCVLAVVVLVGVGIGVGWMAKPAPAARVIHAPTNAVVRNVMAVELGLAVGATYEDLNLLQYSPVKLVGNEYVMTVTVWIDPALDMQVQPHSKGAQKQQFSLRASRKNLRLTHIGRVPYASYNSP